VTRWREIVARARMAYAAGLDWGKRERVIVDLAVITRSDHASTSLLRREAGLVSVDKLREVCDRARHGESVRIGEWTG